MGCTPFGAGNSKNLRGSEQSFCMEVLKVVFKVNVQRVKHVISVSIYKMGSQTMACKPNPALGLFVNIILVKCSCTHILSMSAFVLQKKNNNCDRNVQSTKPKILTIYNIYSL